MNPSFHNLTDQQLIDQTLAGNTDAFGGLVGRHQNRLFNSIVHLMRNESDAEDVVQDAFVLALTKLDSFKGNSQFYTWLFRIARNSAISRLRKKRPKLSLDSPSVGGDDLVPLELPGKVPVPSDDMERQERVQGLMDALGRMSPEHREILVLREMDNLDYETIAEMLELAVGTVRSRLHRARSQLRELLSDAGNGLP